MKHESEKPNGAKAGWKFLGSEKRFENQIFRVRDDAIELKSGEKIQYAYMERDPAVVVVAITKAGEMVMLKQYRYAVDEWCLETPAGGTHDECNASLEEVARKELREEVGATAKSLREIASFYSANALTDEKVHVFLAEDVELSQKREPEPSESIEVQLIPVAKAIELARNGAVKTAPSALAILLCEPYLRKFTRGENTPADQLET